jgi:4-amino-4-deoxy-L-arabinose transferase-like glycosyltransferase
LTAKTLERAILIAILVGYGILAVLYATQTPAWQIPDEPAHYNYVRQIAADGCCPTMAPGDWDAAYQGQIVSSGFDPQYLDRLDAVQYEDHQPPLFYLLAAPIYRAADGSLTAIRLLSAVLGLGVILSAYAIARTITGSGPVALGTAAFVAFVPQHVAILAGAGNDSLAELIVSVGVLLAVWYVTPDIARRMPFFSGVGVRSSSIVPAIVMGFVMGLGFLTKASTFVLGPVIMLAILLRWWRTPDRDWSALVITWGAFLLPALLMGGVWWWRNIGLYGWPDFLGMGRHDAVVVGQPRTADWIAANGFGGWLSDGIATTFRSFWGQFGWMGVPMPGWVYTVLLVFTLVSYAGLIPLIGQVRRGGLTRAQRDGLILLAALYALGIAAFLYYNTAFVQFQGRYLFPAMAAFGLAFAGGWAGWAHLIMQRVDRAWLRWTPAVIMWGLAGLSALALWRFVIPNLPVW